MPDVRRAFIDAVLRMRVISAIKYHDQKLSDEAVHACTTRLESAARWAEQLTPHTTQLPEAEISPECMAALARDTIAELLVMNWHELDARANELADMGWLAAIEEWGQRMGIGDVQEAA